MSAAGMLTFFSVYIDKKPKNYTFLSLKSKVYLHVNGKSAVNFSVFLADLSHSVFDPNYVALHRVR